MRYTLGICDVGYNEPFKPMVLHEADAPGVLLALNTYRIGNHTDASVAKVLNDAGYRSRSRTGGCYGINLALHGSSPI